MFRKLSDEFNASSDQDFTERKKIKLRNRVGDDQSAPKISS